MQAVILAAGLGKRLRPITEMVPKPLVPVNGKPVIEYTLANLPPAVTEIIFVIGHKGYMMRAKFGNFWQGRKIFYVEQKEPLGTGDAVRCAAPLVKNKFLLLYGDDVHGGNGLKQLLRHPAALLVKKVSDPSRFGVVVVNEAGEVERLVEKSKQFAGVFPAAALKIKTPLSPRGEYEFTDVINVLVSQKTLIRAEETDFWLPGNTPEDIKAAALALAAVH